MTIYHPPPQFNMVFEAPSLNYMLRGVVGQQKDVLKVISGHTL